MIRITTYSKYIVFMGFKKKTTNIRRLGGPHASNNGVFHNGIHRWSAPQSFAGSVVWHVAGPKAIADAVPPPSGHQDWQTLRGRGVATKSYPASANSSHLDWEFYGTLLILWEWMGIHGIFSDFMVKLWEFWWDFVGLLCNLMGFYGDQWEFKQKKTRYNVGPPGYYNNGWVYGGYLTSSMGF